MIEVLKECTINCITTKLIKITDDLIWDIYVVVQNDCQWVFDDEADYAEWRYKEACESARRNNG